MRKATAISLIVSFIAIISISFNKNVGVNLSLAVYMNRFDELKAAELTLINKIKLADLSNTDVVRDIKTTLHLSRLKLKDVDFWARYLDPVAYHGLNGPLPVEWETEVFEKFEKPYRRIGAGFTLAELYLDEHEPGKDSLLHLLETSVLSTEAYLADSNTAALKTADAIFLCNRLYLLNLATIYTTGFECPDSNVIVPELKSMMEAVKPIYEVHNESFPLKKLSDEYLSLYVKALGFVSTQSIKFSSFDNFTFIRDYVNPLFAINQQMIIDNNVMSKSYMDYTLNRTANSIFSKQLYNGQNSKGLFSRVRDSAAMANLDKVGKLLFYDPILSGNNQRSCISCHKSKEYFTDTSVATSTQFVRTGLLERNAPSLLNVNYNHLLMLDGKHISMQDQAKAVIKNHLELNCDEKILLKKITSCEQYKKAFINLVKYTPQEPVLTFDHIVSALTFYYSKFSNSYSDFDHAINEKLEIKPGVVRGFNLFMSKAQCGTCHFAPQFNGVKPPYITSEFEVLGVPNDTGYKKLSGDRGRYIINPAAETLNGFRTGTIRNADHTKPYMHNGVFKNLRQVIDFYDGGGGAGRGLHVPNQTLSTDSLHLTAAEKDDLLAFISSLNENIPFELPPAELPVSSDKKLNKRKVGGSY